jgi:hypothetical protein
MKIGALIPAGVRSRTRWPAQAKAAQTGARKVSCR